MTDLFLLIASQLNSSMLVLLVMLIGSYWVIYKVTQIMTSWEGTQKEIIEMKADIAQIKKDVVRIESKLDFLYQAFLEFMGKDRAVH